VADRSAIEWTTATWNPTTGCDRISAGRDNCYALALAGRLKAMGQQKYQNDGDPRTSGPGFAVTVHPDALHIPGSWREPRLVFVDSMSDFSGGVTILKLASPQLRGREFGIKRVRQVSWTGGLAR
jgi:protein gp37